MKKWKFDIHGNLYPPQIIPLSWAEFHQFFVLDFENSMTRQKLVANFIEYLQTFQQQIVDDFTVWIDGSFISNKLNPNDIDAVFHIDYKICETKQSLLEYKFFNPDIKYSKDLDVYYLKNYPKQHKRHFLTHLDELYWQDVYGHTRKDVYSKQYSKGFITIQFNKTWNN
jgi:hypothetical protein